jgi:hypothetical protein
VAGVKDPWDSTDMTLEQLDVILTGAKTKQSQLKATEAATQQRRAKGATRQRVKEGKNPDVCERQIRRHRRSLK